MTPGSHRERPRVPTCLPGNPPVSGIERHSSFGLRHGTVQRVGRRAARIAGGGPHTTLDDTHRRSSITPHFVQFKSVLTASQMWIRTGAGEGSRTQSRTGGTLSDRSRYRSTRRLGFCLRYDARTSRAGGRSVCRVPVARCAYAVRDRGLSRPVTRWSDWRARSAGSATSRPWVPAHAQAVRGLRASGGRVGAPGGGIQNDVTGCRDATGQGDAAPDHRSGRGVEHRHPHRDHERGAPAGPMPTPGGRLTPE
jgi:hypothetical protein